MNNHEKMLYEALNEISIVLDDSVETPVSLSLYLLKLGISDPDAKVKLYQATVQLVLHAKNPDELTVTDFQQEFRKISDVFSEDSNDAGWVIYIVTWIGLNLFPKAYPVSQNLELE